MMAPSVTIIVVPRERFSFARRSLASIYKNTSSPFELIYVDAGTPTLLKKILYDEAEQKGFCLLSAPGYLSPNQARNFAWREVKTKYTVFIDNDALVTPGWLDALVRCADETGAWVVGPLYLIGEIEKQTIHMAGGTVHIKEIQGQRVLYDEQYLFETPIAAVQTPLRRREWDYVEFHCMLVRTDVLIRVGPLDENLLSVQEHIDLCLSVKRAGGSVYMEPKAVTSYVLPPPFEWWDLPYFLLRWSEAWNLATVRYFNRKWGVSSLLWFNDKTLPDTEETIIRFARGHRRTITGLTVPTAGTENSPKTPLEQAQLMIAMFLSVDCDAFNLGVATRNGAVVESRAALGPEKIFQQLPGLLQVAQDQDLDLMIQPLPQGKPREPALIRIEDLNEAEVGEVKPYAFLTLQTNPGRYECWLAIDAPQWRDKATLKRMTGECGTKSWTKLAGNTSIESNRSETGGRCLFRVRVVDGTAGRLFRLHQLEDSGILPHMRSGQLLQETL
jgi:GT2 family glycosyltransferase